MVTHARARRLRRRSTYPTLPLVLALFLSVGLHLYGLERLGPLLDLWQSDVMESPVNIHLLDGDVAELVDPTSNTAVDRPDVILPDPKGDE